MRVAYSKEEGSRKQRICLCSSRLTGNSLVILYAVLSQFCIEKHIKTTTKSCREGGTRIGSGFGSFDCPYPESAEIVSDLRGFYRLCVKCEDSFLLALMILLAMGQPQSSLV